jgi:UDP-N-acetylmuramate dehydrogenase
MIRPAAPFARHAPFVVSNVSLAPFTSFGIGGPAEFYAEPDSTRQMQLLRKTCCDYDIDLYVLGAGTNLLIDDAGVAGLVIRTNRLVEVRREGNRVAAAVGAKLPALIRTTMQWDLGGLGELAGIPGTVGGAVATNAGTRHGCIRPVVESVAAIDADGCLSVVDAGQLHMGYRTADLQGLVVVGVNLDLYPEATETTAARVKQWLAERNATQPTTSRSAGCVFKNPPGDSAGKIIDELGLKGTRCGGAEVSTQHANFIINTGGATAADVRQLIQYVRQCVLDRRGIALELEIECWPRGPRENDR